MKVIIFLISFSLFADLHSQDVETSEDAGLVILNDLIVFTPAFITLIGVHETGHYSMATLAGSHDVKSGLFRRKENGGLQMGWTQLNDTLSTFGHSLYLIGGVLFTRGFSEISNLVVRSDIFPTAINRYFSMVYIMGRFDFSRYVFQDALLNMFGKNGSDIDALVTDIGGRSTGARTLTYLSLLTISVLELAFNWEGIKEHWSILTGGKLQETNQASNLKFRINKNSQGNLSITLSLKI